MGDPLDSLLAALLDGRVHASRALLPLGPVAHRPPRRLRRARGARVPLNPLHARGPGAPPARRALRLDVPLLRDLHRRLRRDARDGNRHPLDAPLLAVGRDQGRDRRRVRGDRVPPPEPRAQGAPAPELGGARGSARRGPAERGEVPPLPRARARRDRHRRPPRHDRPRERPDREALRLHAGRAPRRLGRDPHPAPLPAEAPRAPRELLRGAEGPRDGLGPRFCTGCARTAPSSRSRSASARSRPRTAGSSRARSAT